MSEVRIGTAGWSIPRQIAHLFPADGTALERYSARFPVAEINSSFHRPHRRTTWERWRDSVPAGFRFSVKLPKYITHQLRLVDCAEPLDRFLEEAGTLGEKLGVLLVQLPPKLAFEEPVAARFFDEVRNRSSAQVACEPRHASWFDSDADALLQTLEVVRVAADPAICAEAASPGGSRHMSYWRLHGSPVVYRSSYQDRIREIAEAVAKDLSGGAPPWCIFDNTASSAGAADALALIEATKRV